LSSKLARLLAGAAIAAAPMLAFTSHASATGGCSVDNTNPSFTLHAEASYPPGNASYYYSNETCTYVSGGGSVKVTCNLIAGRCSLFNDTTGHELVRCTTAGATCSSTVTVAAGDNLRLVVDGGSGSAQDVV
jgi:hypothetical protein